MSAAGIVALLSVAFWFGWWRGRAELIGKGWIDVKTSVHGKIDERGRLLLTVGLVARTDCDLRLETSDSVAIERHVWRDALDLPPHP